MSKNSFILFYRFYAEKFNKKSAKNKLHKLINLLALVNKVFQILLPYIIESDTKYYDWPSIWLFLV